MIRWIAFTAIVLMGALAVVLSERRNVDVPASPAAILYLVADTEQELTRMPVSFTRMSDEEEIRIGVWLSRSYGERKDLTSPQDREVEQYLARVGTPLAARAHRKLPYKFHYIPETYLINAFALPGGHVYVGAGLLALMDSEDELASVLGHEIEHVDHYHCAERVQQEEALRRIPLGELVAIPIEIFEAGYSKDQELEADREGTRLAVEAGYSATGALRMFEEFDRLYHETQAKASTPEEEFSHVALQTLEGYFRSHPLPSERIAQIQKLIASEAWPVRSERDLAVAYIFLNIRAEQALHAKKYPVAEQFAKRSLKLRGDQPPALDTLAQAQFSQAKFADAAQSYGKLLGLEPARAGRIELFALSLQAADRKTAPAEFRDWENSIHTSKPPQADVMSAGLALLARDGALARRVEAQYGQSYDPQAPARLGELGWWYYLAGNYEKASSLLGNAVQQRPGDRHLWLRRAFAQIEVKRLSDALQTVGGVVYDNADQAERSMAQAVAFWQAQQPDQALRDFGYAVTAQPEWENPNWVKPLYSPLVAQSVQQMQVERERRRKFQMASNR